MNRPLGIEKNRPEPDQKKPTEGFKQANLATNTSGTACKLMDMKIREAGDKRRKRESSSLNASWMNF